MQLGAGTVQNSLIGSDNKMLKEYLKLLASQGKQVIALIETNDKIAAHLHKSKLTSKSLQSLGKKVSK